MMPRAQRVALLVAVTGALAAAGFPVAAVHAAAPAAPALAERVANLEVRAQRLQDINDIKRLQRSYGYYLDEGQWDDVADLFATDAELEIGFDGVYRGREHIRAYWRANGDGGKGLSPGRLNEHLQVMPVITLGADSDRANGTWRTIALTGVLGGAAHWSEGPAEVLYVKQAGVWKIQRLQWFQTLHVPYAGGWANNADDNGGRFVGDRLRPDAPPSRQYKTWPGAFTPPFHFRGQYPGLVPPASTAPGVNRPLGLRVGEVAQTVGRLSDQDAIENLQRIYGYYLDKGLWSETASLFTADAAFEYQGRGIFRGRERIQAYLRAIGPEGAVAGRLYDHMIEQPVTHVSRNGRSARGRWHVFAQLAQQGQFHEWSAGVYENEYRKGDDGKWRIHRLHYYPTMITPYEQGWGKVSLPASRFEPALTPDARSRGAASHFDHAFVTPFHYVHPVRNVRRVRQTAATVPTDEIEQRLDATERQLAAVEDRASIENIQTAYGYYLATLLWDDLTALFAEDGTIEIALRGVYVGKAAVRRNLNLYGQAGLDDGVLHNHMQFQPVIHVSADGKRANLRSRALSMMGNFGRNATWMGGTYENEFVKVDGRWRFSRDQQVNTYFAPYETGWKDLAQRPAPGITAANPPDRPPSFPFDMYPKNFLLPFHYTNPVTGTRYAPLR